MKRIIVFLFTFIMTLSLVGCANDKQDISDLENTVTDNVSNNEDNKILVAYFSATGNTETVAENIASSLNADLYRITPEEPYTSDDLNYNDSNSRTTLEMNDPSARPRILGSVESIEKYTTVFIGYPIWWNDAPRIIGTFLESYDFSNKTIVPFCTSGGSGINTSVSNLKSLTSGATWLDGKRLNSGDSIDSIKEWINSLELD